MHNSNISPIGLFDSGLGGLSILKEISERLPYENIIYLADSQNAPYGEKNSKQIVDISVKNTEFLLSKKCKMIVVACNTATTNAIDFLREKFKIPFVGIEPAIKPAILHSKRARVGVLATRGTLSSALFAKTSKKYKQGTEIIEVVGKGIVEAIENNTSESKEFEALLKQQLQPFSKAEIDTLVLGCSHYPLIHSQIKKHLCQNVNIIDSGFAVAKQSKRILDEKGLRNLNMINPEIKIFCNQTSMPALENILKRLCLNEIVQINN